MKHENITVEQLTKHVTLYKVAKILGMTPPSVYKWIKNGIPPLRQYQLRELRPEWFDNKK